MTTYEEEMNAYTDQINQLTDLSDLEIVVRYRKHLEDMYSMYHPDGEELSYYREKTEIARARRNEILNCRDSSPRLTTLKQTINNRVKKINELF